MSQLMVRFKHWQRKSSNCVLSEVCWLVGFTLREQRGKHEEETDVSS